MRWQTISFEVCKEKKRIRINFFSSRDNFEKKLKKHILAIQEKDCWEKVFPKILEKYEGRDQFSHEEVVSIYEKIAPEMEKDLQFIWMFPLHIHYERDERVCVLGVSPRGFLVISRGKVSTAENWECPRCKDLSSSQQEVVTFYALDVSEHTGMLQRFFAAIRQAKRKAGRSRNRLCCTESNWQIPFANKNMFESFAKDYKMITPNGGPIAKQIDGLLARY